MLEAFDMAIPLCMMDVRSHLISIVFMNTLSTKELLNHARISSFYPTTKKRDSGRELKRGKHR